MLLALMIVSIIGLLFLVYFISKSAGNPVVTGESIDRVRNIARQVANEAHEDAERNQISREAKGRSLAKTDLSAWIRAIERASAKKKTELFISSGHLHDQPGVVNGIDRHKIFDDSSSKYDYADELQRLLGEPFHVSATVVHPDDNAEWFDSFSCLTVEWSRKE